MTLESLINQALSGLSAGMVVFFCALGLTIAFGTLKVLNLAHGSIFMIGMYICFSASKYASVNYGFALGIAVATIGAAIVGGIMEILILRPIYIRDPLDQFMVTFGAVFVFMDLVKLIWGTEYQTINPPLLLRGAYELWGYYLPKYNISMMLLGFIVFVAVYFIVEKTHWGMVIRGITADRDMMGAIGINVPLAYTIIFMFACGLSGLGGAIMGPMTCVAPGIDGTVLMESFIIVVIGGFGSISGALIGSILFGIINSFGILIIPKMAIGFPFFLMLFILIIRPFGLMGKKIK